MTHLHRRIFCSSILALVLVLLLAGPLAAGSGPFSPVPRGHWAYPALEVLGHAGLLDAMLLTSSEGELTRYEVAGLVAQAEDQLRQGASSLSGLPRAEVALAWLYRVAGLLDGNPNLSGGSVQLSPLARLQGRRQLYWLIPTVNRLDQEYHQAAAGKAPPARAWQVSQRAALLYDRLLQALPPELVAPWGPEVEQLERALAGHLAQEVQAPSELAAQVGEARRAFIQLQSGFGSELQALDLEKESLPELPSAEPPDVATLDDLRELAERGEAPAGEAGLETQVPLGAEGTLKARLGFKRAEGTSQVRPGVDVGVGVGVGEASLYAGWSLVDFSEGGLPQGEGEARLEWPF